MFTGPCLVFVRHSVVLYVVASLVFVAMGCLLQVEAYPVIFGFDLDSRGNDDYPVHLDSVNEWLAAPNRSVPIVVRNVGWASVSTLNATFAPVLEAWNKDRVITLLTWMPYPYDSWWSQTPNDLLIHSEPYTTYIATFIDHLKRLLDGEDGQPDTADDRRAYLCFAPAPNGDWFPWTPRFTGDNMNVTQTPQSYVTLWNTVIGQVRKRIPSRRQLQVVWDVNAGDGCAVTCRAEDFMPDRDLVDWMQITGYNWGSLIPSLGWRDNIRDTFAVMLDRLVPLLHKPIMTNLATTDLRSIVDIHRKETWLRSMIPFAQDNRVSALIYHNSNEEASTSRRHFAVFWDSRCANKVSGDGTFTSPTRGVVFDVFSMIPEMLRDESRVVLADKLNPRLLTDEQFSGTLPPPDAQPSSSFIIVLCVAAALLVAIILGVIVLRRSAQTKQEEAMETLLANDISMTTLKGAYKPQKLLSDTPYSRVLQVVQRDTNQSFAAKIVLISEESHYSILQNEIDMTMRCQGVPHVVKLHNTDMSYHTAIYGSNDGAHSKGSNEEAKTDDKKTSPRGGEHLVINTSHGNDSSSQGDSVRNALLLMKYYKDGDLASYISKQQKPLPPKFVAQVACHIAEALSRIHTLPAGSVIHRDVKPENVLLEDGSACLSDFSYATLNEPECLEHAGKCIGTHPWLSPEAVEGHYSPACDVWGVGCLLFAMMTRRIKENVSVVRELVLDGKSIGELRRTEMCTYPDSLVNIMTECLSVSPSTRPTASQLLPRLRAFMLNDRQ